jgi:hypothetical protein
MGPKSRAMIPIHKMPCWEKETKDYGIIIVSME